MHKGLTNPSIFDRESIFVSVFEYVNQSLSEGAALQSYVSILLQLIPLIPGPAAAKHFLWVREALAWRKRSQPESVVIRE